MEEKRYFLDGDVLLVLKAGTICIVPEVMTQKIIGLDRPPKEIKKESDDSSPRTKTSAIRELLKEGLKAREIVDKLSEEFTDIAPTHVYSVQNKMRKAEKVGDRKYKAPKDDEKDDEDTDPVLAEQRKITPLNDSEEGRICSEIRRLWVDEDMSSVRVCQELKISLGTFNRLIVKYEIAKNQI